MIVALLGTTRADMWPAGYDVADRIPANAYLRPEVDVQDVADIAEPIELVARSGAT